MGKCVGTAVADGTQGAQQRRKLHGAQGEHGPPDSRARGEHGPPDSPARGPARPGRGTGAALGESTRGCGQAEDGSEAAGALQ